MTTNSVPTGDVSSEGHGLRAGPADELANNASLIWGLAELLRGDYKQAEYGRVILPLVVLRRLEQVRVASAGESSSGMSLLDVAGAATPQDVAARLRTLIERGSPVLREVVTRFDFDRQIDRLAETDLIRLVLARIAAVDLSPDSVSNLEMGYLFEELIRRFAEQSNETAGEHFTPREVVRLMVNLLIDVDLRAGLLGDRVSVFDCACGTGGMLSEAHAHMALRAPEVPVELFGQELNQESYAICVADMLVKDQNTSQIKLGNTLAEDLHPGRHFNYGIANPPFGVDWSKVEDSVRAEQAEAGPTGRFAPGLPRKSDGQLLFLLHLVSKMTPPEHGGGRIAIVHNSSPLFSGGAGTGEANIRRYLIEQDLLEAVVALPEQLFYNTGIASFVWLLTNRKSPERRGKVQLINARDAWVRMRRSLGEKRREMTAEHIDAVLSSYLEFAEGPHARIVDNDELGYRAVIVERPLRARWEIGERTWDAVESERALSSLESVERQALAAELRRSEQCRFANEEEATAVIRDVVASVLGTTPAQVLRTLLVRCMVRDPVAPVQLDDRGEPKPDPVLRETEHIALNTSVADHLAREVLPFAPDAWCPDVEGKIGYEIPFTRLFSDMPPTRPSADVLVELQDLEADIRHLLREVLE